MSQGYNLDFRMYMEGVLTPFKSANIICTPNGVEASINMFATKAIYDLKPKTAVQIFYKDWAPTGRGGLAWRIMFDGFYSSIVKSDQATEGRMVSLVCRDFRMDIRRAPAAISYAAEDELTTRNLYSMHGIFQRFVIPGVTSGNKKNPTGGGIAIREYEHQLCPLDQTMKIIAGTAYGDQVKQEPGKDPYYGYGGVLHDDERGKAKCGFFLDAFVRGLWTEASGGTSLGVFLNKRLRVDKRFYIPANKAGYNFWSRQNAGLNVGSYVLGNSRFVNIETAILSCAAMFAVRPYSTSTPSLIPVNLNTLTNPNPAAKFSVDEDVAKFLIERKGSDFGAPYILNESMLLPPMEFTAPPNCNIFLPPVCDRVSWQYDIDADMTRGYYDVLDSLSAYDTSQLEKIRIQVPNSLFEIYKEESKQDSGGRYKPPLTLEERYKGVNVSYGQVEYDVAANDAAASQLDWTLTAKASSAQKEIIAGLKSATNQLNKRNKIANEVAKDAGKEAEKKKKDDAIQERQIKITSTVAQDAINVALKRHAILKFFNEKYSGRVVTIDMVFNPYPMCGFPGMFIDDEEGAGGNSSKTVLGMVQQVKHLIVISPNGAEASTTVVMNNAHFVDEPVDIDGEGNALFMKATDKNAATIDIKTMQYRGAPNSTPGSYNGVYYVPDPAPATQRVLNNQSYDLRQPLSSDPYIYAKDLLSITEKDSKTGESNIMYLDKEYDPQHVALFYRDVFQHTSNSFMVGNEMRNGKMEYFMYDTIHEAASQLRRLRPELMYDYEAVIKFTARNVCSMDAFYQGVLGLSVKTTVDKKDIYTNKLSGYKDSDYADEYFGVTTDLYNSKNIDNLKAENGGTMKSAGEFSSILETMPITAFIAERKAAVLKYIKDADSMGQGIRFTVPQGK
jgi:hypothetical protein